MTNAEALMGKQRQLNEHKEPENATPDISAQTVEEQSIKSPPPVMTIHDLGWTSEQATAIRDLLSAFAEDWDDPAMDIYIQSIQR